MVQGGAAAITGRAVRRCPRLLVTLVLGLVTLGFVGMHQLSLGHHLPPPTTASQDHLAGTHPAVSSVASGPALDATTAEASTTSADQRGTDAAAGVGGGCSDCGDHTVGPGVCVPALTLLVLLWWLRLPERRALPPAPRRPGPSGPVPPRPARRRAPSLAELSVLRT